MTLIHQKSVFVGTASLGLIAAEFLTQSLNMLSKLPHLRLGPKVIVVLVVSFENFADQLHCFIFLEVGEISKRNTSQVVLVA